MKYKCLVLDHDDTSVKSTSELHYPAFRLIMEKMRPDHEIPSLRTFIEKNFEPGIVPYYQDELGFTGDEFLLEQKMWKDYIKDKTPHFFEGFIDIIKHFKEQGGYVCVVSHSLGEEIMRHYSENGITADMIFGRELPIEQQKPNPYPLHKIMETYGLEPENLIMVDDLRFGYEMAEAAGVDFAAAGWGYEGVPIVEEYMRENSDYYFETVKEFSDFIFEENQ